MNQPDMASWSIAERYMVDRMDRMEQKLDLNSEKLYEIHGETSALKVRASVFGLFGGFLAALLSLFGIRHS